jgi:hypothetical protein
MKLLLVVLLFALTCSRADAHIAIPEFAKICGIRVGYDMMDTLERRMGLGSPHVNGRPNSARRWLSTRANCDIDTGATWNYDGPGVETGPVHPTVIDLVSITPIWPDAANRARARENDLPEARVAPDKTRFMGVVSLGMSKAEVLAALGTKLPSPTVEKGAFVWHANGPVLRGNLWTMSWRAKLKFKDGKLQEIRIEARIVTGVVA